MDNKSMEIDQSILDEDDSTIMGRESISSLFVRACGMEHEDQPSDCTPSSSAHTPLAKPGFPHAYYLARAACRSWQQTTSLCGVGPYASKVGSGDGGVRLGSFDVKGDSQQFEGQNFTG